MSEGNRKENLELAITNHIAALGMLTEASRPLDYAKIQYNMGCAYVELTNRFAQSFRDQAKHCFENATRVFRNIGMASDARKAENALQAIDTQNSGAPSVFGAIARLFKQ